MPGSSPMQGGGRIAVESNGGGGGGPRSGSIAALAAADRRAVETAGVSSREVSHATWHVGASPAPHVAVQDASAHLEGSARTMESPYRGVARAHRLGEKKPSFNMRVRVLGSCAVPSVVCCAVEVPAKVHLRGYYGTASFCNDQ